MTNRLYRFVVLFLARHLEKLKTILSEGLCTVELFLVLLSLKLI